MRDEECVCIICNVIICVYVCCVCGIVIGGKFDVCSSWLNVY